MKLVELQSGTILTWRHLLVMGAPRGIRFEVPVKCFYIEHNGHRILFDAGQKPLDYQQKPDDNFLVKVTPPESAAELLRGISVDPATIDYLILSHLHFDHIAGVEDFPQAKVIVQQREAASRPLPRKDAMLIDGEFDLFNDQRIICVPTYGHTPGHQCLKLMMDDSTQILLTADVAYTHEALTYEYTAEEYQKKPEFFDSLCKLRAMQQRGIKLIHSHE